MGCDFLVIGSGIAGLNFALRASEFGNVCVITKKNLVESNTNFAQGGIAAVFSKKDSFDLHVNDTLKAGDGLCNREAVRIMVREAPHEIDRLLSMGADFDMRGNSFELGMEGGHSRKRIVHRGDLTGQELENVMVKSVRAKKSIKILEKHMAFDLIIKSGRCIGVRAMDKEGPSVKDVFAKAVVLATGGLCEVYENTSNPEIATGDGVAMAYRAGCGIKNIEFVQFHPTAFRRKGQPFFLISEALRGEGGKLLNSKGRPFVDEMALRDRVSRAILEELNKGKVYLDVSGKGERFLKRRFPGIYKACMENGIDISQALIPVEPVAHYSCGGVITDVHGRTEIPGLFALGEVACTGVHGANRLASNSLLESMVFSSRAARAAREYVEGGRGDYKNLPKVRLSRVRPQEIRIALKGLMWRNAGVVRSREGLEEALVRISELEKEFATKARRGLSEDIIEIGNMILVSKLILRAAIMREESRGTHYREDHPKKNPRWQRSIVLRKRAKDI